jgi:S-formylglutathione hydrolase
VSAFAPIANPSNCLWGQKAFTGYLGLDREMWKEYDATELVKKYSGPILDIKIDQGSDDEFLMQNQLLPENFQNCCSKFINLDYNLQDGYDHSYWFIQSFIDQHLEFHFYHFQ